MNSILVVDDNENIRKLMKTVLFQNGYRVLCAENGEDALSVIEHEHVDLLIVDIMMPKMDGYDLTKTLRDVGYDKPVLMITAKEAFSDKRQGFLSGADDYMVKPVDMNEVVLRIQALLRRSKIANEHKIVVGPVTLMYDALNVITEDETIELPKKEFYLLFLMLSYPKKIFTRRQLMDEVWGLDAETDERTVDVHIKRLREKLDHIDAFKIITVRGLGYKAERNV